MAKGCVYIPKTGKDAGKVFGSKDSLAAHMNYTPALTDLMAKFEQSGGKADIDSVTKWLSDNGYLKEKPAGKPSRRERLAKMFEEPKVEVAPEVKPAEQEAQPSSVGVGGDVARKSMSKEIDSQISAKENELIEKQKQDIEKAKKDLEAINNGDKSVIDEYVKKSGYKPVTKEVIANNPKSELLKKSEGKYYNSTGASIQVKTAEQIAIDGASKKANSKPTGSKAGTNQYVDAYNAITKFSEGKITAEEAKSIIEKAGLEVPSSIQPKAKEAAAEEKKITEKTAQELNKEAGIDLFVARKPIEVKGEKFVLSQIKENNNENTFIVEDEKGKEIGRAQLSADGNYVENIRIDEKHRRKGLASSIYNFIEDRKGIKLSPSPIKQSKEAKALWDKRSKQASVAEEKPSRSQKQKPFSGIKNLFKNGFGGKRISEREAQSLNRELNTLIDRAEKENGVQRDNLKNATWKTNDGYTITEFFENKRGGTRIITPEGEEINIYDNKYKSETGKEISYFPEAGKPAAAAPEVKPSEQQAPTRQGKIASLFEEEETTQAGKESSDEAFVDDKIEQVKENGKPLSEFKEGDRVIWASDWDKRFKQYVEGVVVKQKGEYGIKRSSQNPLSKEYPVAIFNGSTRVIPKPEGEPIYTGEENFRRAEGAKATEIKPKTPKPASKVPDKKGIPSKFTKDNIGELVGATVVVNPSSGPMKVLEVRGPFDPYEGYATFNTKKGLTEEYVLIGEDDTSTSVFINNKGELEYSIEESVFTSDPNAKYILKEATEETPLSITKFKKGDIVKYVKDGQQYEVLSVDPKALSSIKNIQTGEVISVAYPADFLPSSREEVAAEKTEVTPEETVAETATEEVPVNENEAVNQLITKKSRYNKIPKSRKPLAGKLLNEIKEEAEALGFTIVNVKGGNISVVSKKNGKVVARRDVDRGFYKEQNEKVKQAKSMARDFTFGLRGTILLYFLGGGKVSTSSSELGEGSKELEMAKRAGLVSDTATGADMIAKYDLKDLGAFVFDEQEAITEIQDVLASFENKEQMEDELVEMFEKDQRDQDEAAKYEYEYQMRAAIRNDELVGLDEDELVEYYESLSEDEKAKTIEDYEKFYQEIEREQLDQRGQGGAGISPSEGETQEERGAESPKSKRLKRAEELRAKAQDLRDASGGTLMAGPKLLAAAYEAYAAILETTENIIDAIKKFKATKEYKDLDVNGKKELDVVLATDAVEEEISSGRDPQEAVDDLIGSQEWYQSLPANQKEQLDEILKDDFGVTPKAKTGIKATIANIIDNYYKGDRQSKLDNKRILESDPKLKYIYDNISSINKQLQAAGVITDKTDGCP